MAQHNLTQAAKLAGISRSTIMRHISEGKVSKALGKDGKPYIETSELERVYNIKQSQDSSETASVNSLRTPKKEHEDSQLCKEVQTLREEKVALLEERIKTLQDERNDWRDQAERALRLLADQRPASEMASETPQKPSEGPSYHLGWFDRLLGRKPLSDA